MSTQAVTAEDILRLAENVSLQPLGGDEGGVLLRMDTGQIYAVNDTALAFLAALDGNRSVREASRLLVDQYDVETEALAMDMSAIASELLSEALIERVT